MLRDISDNLVSICDAIIEDQQQVLLKSNVKEYSKNGKKYKLTSDGNFIRVQGENKHLIVSESYEDFKCNYSILSSYYILANCGTILNDFNKLSLAIIFTSREIELNKWYDESSKICSIENSCYDPLSVEDDALSYISNIDSDMRFHLINLGTSILTATKINFFQTDHNVTSPTLEGYALRTIMSENFGENSLTSVDVYNALRAFSHWCSVRGVLYKLGLPNLKIDSALVQKFKSFPEIPSWIGESVHCRYPAGCSKIALIKKSLVVLSTSVYGKLIESPHALNIKQLLSLCNQIENDPLRYHIRNASLKLSTNPYLEVGKLFTDSNKWIEYISCLLHAINNHRLPYENKLLVSNKILKINKIKDKKLFKQTFDLVARMKTVEKMHGSNVSDGKLIDLMGGPVRNSLFMACQPQREG